jgi:predicted CXXCH cytochrome family protein
MMRRLLSIVVAAFACWTVCPGAVVTVNEPAVCFDCHAEAQEWSTRKHVHTAFTAGVCSDCHNPHASTHSALLNKETKDLCLTCHEDLRAHLAETSVHRPAQSGECLACHDAHASDQSNHLVAGENELCGTCHTGVGAWKTQAYVHQPVAENKCGTCHLPHGSPNEGLLKNPVPGLCFGCHAHNAALAGAHQGFSLDQADCGTCHDPHGAAQKGLLMANQHAPFKGGKCGTCHRTGAGSDFALLSDIKSQCGACHAQIAALAEKPHAHNMNDQRSCMNCHNAHASATTSLLAAPQTTLCMRCHFNDQTHRDKGLKAFLTHNGMECSTCHTAHGSDNAQYLKSLDVELCVDCHAGAHTASHPIGPNVIDKRTNAPLTCLSCHKLHGADFPQYLPLDPTMDLCIQCHRR